MPMCIASRYPPQEFDPVSVFGQPPSGSKALYIEAHRAWRVFFAGKTNSIEQDRSPGGKAQPAAAPLRQRLMRMCLASRVIPVDRNLL
jgi:hypothetical protein